MSIFSNVCLFLLIFFSGCDEVILTDENITSSTNYTDEDIPTHSGSLPVLQKVEGAFVDISSYLYPSDLSQKKSIYFDNVFKYSQTQEGVFNKGAAVLSKHYTKVVNSNTARISEYEGNVLTKYDDIFQYKILSYEADKNFPIEYPVRVAKNSKIVDFATNNIQHECVVVSIGSYDLTKVLPIFVKNDLKNLLVSDGVDFRYEQFHFKDILHVYCGSGDNKTIDRYYSKIYGKVLEIQKDINKNLLKVEVVDIFSERVIGQ